MAQTHFPPQWRERLLCSVNAKVNAENLLVLDAQARAEGVTLAVWNPLHTTLRLMGSTNFNDVGVQNYKYNNHGIAATQLTLAGHWNDGTLIYPGILGDYQAGWKKAEDIVRDRRVEFIRWGTNPDNILSVIAQLRAGVIPIPRALAREEVVRNHDEFGRPRVQD